MKYLFKEIDNDKKLNEVLDRYKNLIKLKENKTKSILLLVPNNNTKLVYNRKLNLKYSEELNINTYIGFIKKEIIKYWPIITESCNKVNKNIISPKFISNSLSEYIINERVRKKRNLEGYFEDITGTNRNIAMSINTNINKAALSLIDFKTIGEKIYLSKKNRDKLLRFSYSQMDEIIDYYINILLSNAMLDNSLSIYLYNNYLLTSEVYLNSIKDKIEYLIVDSLENCCVAEIDFIDVVSKYNEDSFIYFNPIRDYSVFNNIDINYTEEKIIKSCIQETNISTELLEIEDLYSLPVNIELYQSSTLYSDMIDEICNKIIELVNSGVNINDISIISPINNNVLDYQIKNKLNKENIEVINTKKDRKIIDYPYSNTLLVATCIFYEYEDYIKDEEYISFIEIILSTNRIHAFKILNHKEENSRLDEIIKYIKDKRKLNISIDEFLIQFYIDKLLNLKEGKSNVNICKSIISESEVFVDSIKSLGLDKDKSSEHIFIEALKTTINDFYSNYDIEELKNSNSILITTPYSYISSNINRPIQLWVDIGSNAWNMKIEKELSNIVVLRNSFEERKIYTDAMEESCKKYYLYNLIYSLMVNAKEIYAYKSEYTVNGYIQESILYSLLLKILDKEDIYE